MIEGGSGTCSLSFFFIIYNMLLYVCVCVICVIDPARKSSNTCVDTARLMMMMMILDIIK